jgi:hypothetical protein
MIENIIVSEVYPVEGVNHSNGRRFKTYDIKLNDLGFNVQQVFIKTLTNNKTSVGIILDKEYKIYNYQTKTKSFMKGAEIVRL